MSYKPKKGAIQPIVLYSEDGTAIEFKYLKQQEIPENTPDKHVCAVCGEEFTTKQGLNSHSRVHK
jgi:hypothetical protein